MKKTLSEQAMGPDDLKARLTYERMIIELHDLIRAGRSDEDETDELRERMVEIKEALRPESRAFLENLSGDLYMLQGEEVLEEEGARISDLPTQLKSVWGKGDWAEALTLLRHAKIRDVVPDHVRASLRDRSWSNLGYFHAASCFFEHAVSLSPENDNYAYFALGALLKCGRTDEALRRADAIVRDETSSARRLYKAADVLFYAARHVDGAAAATVYERVLLVLDRALERDRALPAEDRLPALTVGGYVHRGLCHEHLGEPRQAKEAYTAALEEDPNSDVALTARGLLLYGEECPTEALLDFERAVETGTPLVWPYVYLAFDALRKDEPTRCLLLARQAEKRTQDPVMRANIAEWIAIATARQGAAQAESIARFQEAQVFNPLSARIAENLRHSITGDHAALIVANDTTVEAAREQLSEALRPTG
ncbi:tetratricopeptide repeat protein [Chondromyces crocatus]|uniref:Uncharacterized protein n=1 Tax=Chondromyces crocatus TaxID=52 RepID=A0A0K1EFI4_CHOCO|nr:tetratricopeptide repeat protein [Chondromyces crocatus]AKT39348.1 uncharacterized protein CMC5_034950 [Chondromyces crocatus]